jgi:glutamate synthase (ferredoxin)
LFSLQGNLNWMRSRETTLQSPVWRGREHEIRPFGDPKASDSANLDSTAEVSDQAQNLHFIREKLHI